MGRTKRPRKTAVERRMIAAAERGTLADPSHERDLLACLAATLREHPQELPAVVQDIQPNWFDLEGAKELVIAFRVVAGTSHRTRAALELVIRQADSLDGIPDTVSPTASLFAQTWDAITLDAVEFPTLKQRLDADVDRVRLAFDNRQKAREALDTLHGFGLQAGPPATAPRGVSPPLRNGVPVITVRPTNRAEVIDKAEARLADGFFVRDGRLVTVADAALGPIIVPASKERVADHLERTAAFIEILSADASCPPLPAPCPAWLPPMLVGKQRWPVIRELRGIMRGPYLRPDGTIGGTSNGYDAKTKLLTVTDADWSAVNHDPTDADVRQAVEELLDVVKDFPFEAGSEDVGRAVWVAALLTLAGRPAFDGPAPLFLFDATTAGSGKTTLAKLLSVIVRGVDPPLAGMPASTAELKKAMTAALLRGDAMHVFDNCTTTIGNEVLDMLLTSTNYQDRRLGTNETIVAEARMLLVATSNNAGIGADTARRTLTLRLRPLTDRPEEQEFDRDPIEFAADNRERLLPAALTILRWHAVQGSAGLTACRPLGSFNGWSRAIRLAVIRAGLPDPVESQTMVRRIDDDTRLRAAFLEAWEAWRPGFRGTARSMISTLFDTRPDKSFADISDEADSLRSVILDVTNCATGRPTGAEVRRLAYKIRSMRGRLFNGRCVDSDGHGKDGHQWRLATAARPDGFEDDLAVVQAADEDFDRDNWGRV
jgi:hypothetical protein